MIKIESVKQLGLSITWRLLYIAICEKQLQGEDVIEFAFEKLEKGDDRSEVCELAGTYADEQEEIKKLLWDLISQENTQNSFEKRKLRAAIVSDVLEIKNDNYINGLMELTDLWSSLGYPDDSPHTIQGRDNHITPSEYYSVDNYNILYQKNVDWLRTELAYLRQYQ